jgi:nitrogenase molybdenum-cofactor synthesis protein NifE
MLELVRQLALTLESPVWEAVRKLAPWRAHQFSETHKPLHNVGYAVRTSSETVEATKVRAAYPTTG